MDLLCDWAQFLYLAAGSGIDQQAIIVSAMWYRESPPMASQYYVNREHPKGDIVTRLLVCGTSADRSCPNNSRTKHRTENSNNDPKRSPKML